jgi:glycerol-3-phosphate cytidylyltransferase
MKIGITCSTFDLLHAGHVIMLEDCKKHCDYLICALQVDPSMADRKDGVVKNPPVQSLVERYLQLDAVKWVDKIIPYTTELELEEIFKALPINVRIIGEEYREKNFTAREICERRGIEIVYNKREHDYSTSDLRVRTSKAEQNREIRKGTH